jgi:class 3 adenylate cyclase
MADSDAPPIRGFFFADLRGYTEFVERHGDQAASVLLGSYRSLVRAAVADFRGAEIRTEGDGFYVVFPSPSSAIRCGLQILQQAAASTAAAGEALPVGIGIHAGETEEGGEGFVGSAANIAARILRPGRRRRAAGQRDPCAPWCASPCRSASNPAAGAT